MLAIRQAASGTPFATAQVERLRSMLTKGAAKVRVSAPIEFLLAEDSECEGAKKESVT